MRMRAVIAALSCVFALVGSPVSAQPLTFITLDSDASNPSGINDSGDIVGPRGRTSITTAMTRRVYYFEFSGFLDSGERAHDHRAPDRATGFSAASAINDAGEIVG